MLEPAREPQLLCPHWSQWVVTVSLGHPHSLWSIQLLGFQLVGGLTAPSFLLPHYKVPSCSAVREMKAPLTGFAELEPHGCFPSVTYFFFNTTPFSYMFFHSLYTNNFIKFYSTFSPISHFKIYSNLMLLQCHVRKQIKFIFISLSYKTICSNRDPFLF